MSISNAVKAAITRFDKAAQAAAFIGAEHPDDRGPVQHQYERARDLLERAIEREISK